MAGNVEVAHRVQPTSSRLTLPKLGEGFAQVVPALILILLLFNVPLVIMLGWSFYPLETPLANYEQIFTRSIYLKVIGNTFYIAALTTVACCLLGYPLCYWMWRLSPRWRLIIASIVVLTFWVSILVRTYAWIVILGNDGIVNRLLLTWGLIDSSVSFLYNQTGVIIGTTNVLLPFMVLPLFAAMMRLDRRILLAAETLGAPKGVIFWKIFFPLTLPSLAAGAILIFILTLGFFITPAILGGGRVPMIANMMDLLINRLPRWELAAAISGVLLVFTMIFFAGYQWLNNRQQAS